MNLWCIKGRGCLTEGSWPLVKQRTFMLFGIKAHPTNRDMTTLPPKDGSPLPKTSMALMLDICTQNR